ncbi:MAG: L-lactate dehydrogenase [Desulfobacterales bacterium]|nr:L-lactate dehydrogenase [Desulfobacterales bacterium]
MIQKRTIGIVGTGHVGVAAAYAIFMRGLASEIILIDKDAERAAGEAMDLMHGQIFFERITVRAGQYQDLSPAQLVVITAGVAQRAGESRLDLLNRNAAVFEEIVGQLDHHTPRSVLLIASNPVDILTHVAQNVSGRSPSRVIGTGTMLDTGRFRALLGAHYGIDPQSVHAYIIGEHGDTEVPLWSTAQIAGLPLVNNTVLNHPWRQEEMDRLFTQVRDAAYTIIDRKGYTNTAIGMAIVRLAEAVLDDQKRVLPVSRMLNGEYGLSDVCLSIPSVVGIDGVEGAVLPPLNADELQALRHSAQTLQAGIDNIRA